jgi:hypothetical protein
LDTSIKLSVHGSESSMMRPGATASPFEANRTRLM